MSNFIVIDGLGGSLLITDGYGSSVIVSGLIFSSGMISSTSTFSSGILTPVYLTSIPSMMLKEEAGYNVGEFSITVQSPIEDHWNFYLEARNSPSGFITYTASGSFTNQYGFYKELLILNAGLTDIASFRTPGYIWAQNVSGNYTTGKIPVYFRKIG